MVIGLRDLIAAIGQLDLDGDIKAFCHALDPGLGAQIGESGCAVQDVAQLFTRQSLGFQGADKAQDVLGRAQVQLHQGEVDMGALQDGFGPGHHGLRHVDHDEVEVRPRHVDDAADILWPDDVEGQHVGGGGQDVEFIVKSQHGLQEGVAVDVLGVRQQFKNRFFARQIKVGGSRTELEIEVDEADARGFLAQRRQFPCKVGSEGRSTRAAAEPVDGQDHGIAVALGLEARMRHGLWSVRRRGGGDDGSGHRCGSADALDRLVQCTFGQWVGQEIIGAEPQKLMQGHRADLVGDQQDFDIV